MSLQIYSLTGTDKPLDKREMLAVIRVYNKAGNVLGFLYSTGLRLKFSDTDTILEYHGVGWDGVEALVAGFREDGGRATVYRVPEECKVGGEYMIHWMKNVVGVTMILRDPQTGEELKPDDDRMTFGIEGIPEL